MKKKYIHLRVSDSEYEIIRSKSKGNISDYLRVILFKDGEESKSVPILHGGVTRETPKVANTIEAPFFPYENWTIVPNPENGKIEPVMVDEGRVESVSIRSPKGVEILVREDDPLYVMIWERLYNE